MAIFKALVFGLALWTTYNLLFQFGYNMVRIKNKIKLDENLGHLWASVISWTLFYYL